MLPLSHMPPFFSRTWILLARVQFVFLYTIAKAVVRLVALIALPGIVRHKSLGGSEIASFWWVSTRKYWKSPLAA
ncbi:hypothetical protein D7231_02790 [Streptomyces klenkii]|uniref:Uncharacterized protein n=1 Tax=Streptomyces klenkii TaxID=1420899 RepID=A0A3B0C2Z0_9ACTN|nr:hypothetical protein D7231_02790 [Streptomyces klenkii]